MDKHTTVLGSAVTACEARRTYRSQYQVRRAARDLNMGCIYTWSPIADSALAAR